MTADCKLKLMTLVNCLFVKNFNLLNLIIYSILKIIFFRFMLLQNLLCLSFTWLASVKVTKYRTSFAAIISDSVYRVRQKK